MKVLVIGSSGFVGRELVTRLLADGHEVEAWDRVPGLALPGLHPIQVDLLSGEPLPVPEGSPWDVAIHLAAHSVPGITWSQALVMENLTMTARVFDHLALHSPGSRPVFVSSAYVYGKAQGALSENGQVGPSNLYGLSKALGELWVLSLKEALRVFVVRPFNLLGPNMAHGLLVPELLPESVQHSAPTIAKTATWRGFAAS